jgi:hypothetical protein
MVFKRNSYFYLVLLFIINLINKKVLAIDCVSVEPKEIQDCTNASFSYNSCCFFIKTSGRKACIWWGSKFKGSANKSDGLTYHCENPQGYSCGTGRELSAAECDVFSARGNTCCHTKNNDTSGCVWWGSTLSGNGVYNGTEYSCNSSYMRFSIFLLIFIIFIAA